MDKRIKDLKSQQRLPLDEILRQQYSYHKNHDRSSYTWLKARMYMRMASWIVYYLQDKSIPPIGVTFLYGVVGLIGGILLAMPMKGFVLIALLIFYVKGVLDWSDGHLARIKNQTSIAGRDLDIFCGKIGVIAFYLGVGVFFSNITGYFVLPYILLIVYLTKEIGLPISRACVIDSIILLVGVLTLTLDKF